MLLISKTEAGKAVADLHLEREELNIEVAAIVDQLAKIRGDAVRLMSDRTELTVEVSALREEVRALHEAFQQIEHARSEQDLQIEARDRRQDDIAVEATKDDDHDASFDDGFDNCRIDDDDDDDDAIGAVENHRQISAEAEELVEELEANKSAKQQRETLIPRRTTASSFAADDETEQAESQAFDAFFHAEIDHDKSRDWILG